MTDYHLHNQIMVPEDLQAGDIIRCTMRTFLRDSLTHEMCKRNVMVLGFQLNPETLDYAAIHVARFSYDSTFSDESTNYFFNRDMERRGLIHGLDTPVILRADRTDFIPLTQDHFHMAGADITRIGRVSPLLFRDIRIALKYGHRDAERRRSYYPVFDQRQWYVPAAHLAGSNADPIDSAHPYTTLSAEDITRIKIDTLMRKDPQKIGGEALAETLASLDKLTQQTLYRLARENNEARQERRRARQVFKYAHFHVPDAVEAMAMAARPDSAPESRPVSPEETMMLSLPRFDLSKLSEISNIVDAYRAKEESQTFNVTLPKHLWQGRYLMLSVPTLLNDEDDRNAYRPCAVWKAYADRETGKLAGFELHPVTRSAAHKFDHKLKVYPLDTVSRIASYLIADCIVRVPLDDRFFHENQLHNFFELAPDKLEKFREKREFVIGSGVAPHIHGLQTVPENWVEIPLAPTPSFSQFVKWGKRNEMRYDGSLNDNKRDRQHPQRYSEAKPT